MMKGRKRFHYIMCPHKVVNDNAKFTLWRSYKWLLTGDEVEVVDSLEPDKDGELWCRKRGESNYSAYEWVHVNALIPGWDLKHDKGSDNCSAAPAEQG